MAELAALQIVERAADRDGWNVQRDMLNRELGLPTRKIETTNAEESANLQQQISIMLKLRGKGWPEIRTFWLIFGRQTPDAEPEYLKLITPVAEIAPGYSGASTRKGKLREIKVKALAAG